MNDKIGIEHVEQLKKEQKEFLLQCWQPEDGDVITDGKECFLLYKERALPLSSGKEMHFSKDLFLPLLSLGRLYELIEKNLGEEAIRFGTSAVGTHWERLVPHPLDNESIEHLWGAFLEFSYQETEYQSLVNELGNFLTETFSSYVKDGVEDDRLTDEDFINDELRKKDEIRFDSILERQDSLYNIKEIDEESVWDDAWAIFNENTK